MAVQGLQFVLGGEVTSVYHPDDNADISYVSVAIVGATIPLVAPRDLAKSIREGMEIEAQGRQKYQDKKGKLTVKFEAAVLRPSGGGTSRTRATDAA